MLFMRRFIKPIREGLKTETRRLRKSGETITHNPTTVLVTDDHKLMCLNACYVKPMMQKMRDLLDAVDSDFKDEHEAH